VYFDSSVVLRVVLGERGRLKEWSRASSAVTSEITRVECLRALDRLRIDGGMADRELARRRSTALTVLSGFELARLNRVVLERAAEPFPIRVRARRAARRVCASRAGAISSAPVRHARRRPRGRRAGGGPIGHRRLIEGVAMDHLGVTSTSPSTGSVQ
jgi:hypothetical protein